MLFVCQVSYVCPRNFSCWMKVFLDGVIGVEIADTIQNYYFNFLAKWKHFRVWMITLFVWSCSTGSYKTKRNIMKAKKRGYVRIYSKVYDMTGLRTYSVVIFIQIYLHLSFSTITSFAIYHYHIIRMFNCLSWFSREISNNFLNVCFCFWVN